MKLSFDPNPSDQYPHGYWYACTDNGDHDAVGVTPLNAVTALVEELEDWFNLRVRS
jgi:hypothetical protein